MSGLQYWPIMETSEFKISQRKAYAHLALSTNRRIKVRIS